MLKYQKIKHFIVKNVRKFGLFLSFGITTYKAFDYRSRYLAQIDINTILNEDKNGLRDENQRLKETYNNVLLNISMDNYSINDIKLPFCFMILDESLDRFRMVKFNMSYQQMYGDNPSKYFANLNADLKGEIGEEWDYNNSQIKEFEKIYFFYERYVSKEGKVGIGRFAKWKLKKSTGVYLYVLQTEL